MNLAAYLKKNQNAEIVVSKMLICLPVYSVVPVFLFFFFGKVGRYYANILDSL